MAFCDAAVAGTTELVQFCECGFPPFFRIRVPQFWSSPDDPVSNPGVAFFLSFLTRTGYNQFILNISDVEISNCKGEPILMQDGGSSVGYNQIYDCIFRNNGQPLRCQSGPGNNIIGPGNLVENAVSFGIPGFCDNDHIIGNEIFNAGEDGIMVSGGVNGEIKGNPVVGGVRNVSLMPNASGWEVWHNTLVSARSEALATGNGAAADVQNNIFAYSGGWGVSASTVPSPLDYNLYYGNVSGDCNGCTIGLNAVTDDPAFVDMVSDNYLLDTGSNAIDAGADLGWDLNGSTSGNYNGMAPDIGYDETE